MERVFPMVPLAKRQALCVGIMSYDGQINFGLIGDYDAMAELEDLADDLQASLEELVDAAGGRRRLFRRDRSEAASNGHGRPEEAAASQD
jgi:diacylglycerol O-acyltransferase